MSTADRLAQLRAEVNELEADLPALKAQAAETDARLKEARNGARKGAVTLADLMTAEGQALAARGLYDGQLDALADLRAQLEAVSALDEDEQLEAEAAHALSEYLRLEGKRTEALQAAETLLQRTVAQVAALAQLSEAQRVRLADAERRHIEKHTPGGFHAGRVASRMLDTPERRTGLAFMERIGGLEAGISQTAALPVAYPWSPNAHTTPLLAQVRQVNPPRSEVEAWAAQVG